MTNIEKMLRGLLAILATIPIGTDGLSGPTTTTFAVFVTYMAFTAISGECLVRHFIVSRAGTNN